MKRKRYTKEEMLERSVLGLTERGKMNWRDLGKNVKMMIHQGIPADCHFNNLYIVYDLLDDFGMFKLHFTVTNAWTGNQRVIYNKDYVGKEGNLNYRAITTAIRRT